MGLTLHEIVAINYGLYIINERIDVVNGEGEELGSSDEDVWRIMWKVKDGLTFYSGEFETKEEAEKARTWMYQWHTKRGGLGFILREWDDEDDDE